MTLQSERYDIPECTWWHSRINAMTLQSIRDEPPEYMRWQSRVYAVTFKSKRDDTPEYTRWPSRVMSCTRKFCVKNAKHSKVRDCRLLTWSGQPRSVRAVDVRRINKRARFLTPSPSSRPTVTWSPCQPKINVTACSYFLSAILHCACDSLPEIQVLWAAKAACYLAPSFDFHRCKHSCGKTPSLLRCLNMRFVGAYCNNCYLFWQWQIFPSKFSCSCLDCVWVKFATSCLDTKRAR